MSSENLNDILDDMDALRKLGMRALLEKLGPVGMIDFLHRFYPGSGDYTEERQQWLDKLSMEDIINEIKEMKENKEI